MAAAVLNHFCQIRKTKQTVEFCQVSAGLGSPVRWRCTISIPGLPVRCQQTAANKKLAQDSASKELVETLESAGFLNGLPQGLLQQLRASRQPSWAPRRDSQEPPAKRLKGKGKGKLAAAIGPLPPGALSGQGVAAVALTPETQALLERIIQLLRFGRADEALQLVNVGLRYSPGCVSVKRFVTIVSAISLRTPVEAVLHFFDAFQSLGLVAFPMQTGITYFLRFSRWAVREFLSEGQQAIERTAAVTPQMLERNGNCIQQLTVVPGGGKTNSEFTLAVEPQLPVGHGFQRGDWLLVTAPHNAQVQLPGSTTTSMTVEAELVGFVPGGPGPQSGLLVKVVGSTTQELSDLAGKTCRVDRAANRVTFCRQMEALRIFCGEPGGLAWVSEILMAAEEEGGEGMAVAKCCAPPSTSYVMHLRGVMEQANASQLEALKAATTRRVTLIQGPPGCGKTSTSIMLMQMLGQSGQTPVLATADSNIAVDNLVMGCAKVGLKVVRLGRHEASRVDLRKYNLSEQAKASCPGADTRTLWGTEKRLLSDADVVCCTCSGAATAIMEEMTFPCVLVDEAGQATELSVLVPLMYLKPDGFFVLIGDHKQLPATVACQEAEQEGLGNSLFERLVAQGVQPVMLDTQYRMHPAIAAFPSRQYYQGMLKNGVRGESRTPPTGIRWPVPEVPVAFKHVDGSEAPEGNSYTNYAEMLAVLDMLKKAQARGDLTGADIGIITPYAAQARCIRQQLGVPPSYARGSLDPATLARLAQMPEVSSVDGFQGREKELILVSPVRANAAGRVGFTADPRRLNVTMTRARRGLLIVGHYRTLASDEHGWKPWLDWLEARGLIVGRPATDGTAAEELASLHKLTEAQLLEYHVHLHNRYLLCALRVQDGIGAGLDLQPEAGGMRVQQVHEAPGQPDLRPGDLIRAIDGVALGPDVMQVGAVFGHHFRDGAILTVSRQ